MAELVNGGKRKYIERCLACAALINNTDLEGHDLEEAINAVCAVPAADVVPGRDFRDCRNELCLKCGNYTQKHNGACDGCRWEERQGV